MTDATTPDGTHICDECGRGFGTKRGLGVHQSSGHEKPWDDPERLRSMYHGRGLTSYEIAGKLGCTQPQIRISMDNFGIDRRSISEALTGKRSKKAQFKHPCWSQERYPCWMASNGAGEVEKFYVHRLLAIAEYGVDAVKGKEVHHKNGVKWDNRPDNIELVGASEHRAIHNTDHSIDREEISRLYNESDLSDREIGRRFGVRHGTVARIGGNEEHRHG